MIWKWILFGFLTLKRNEFNRNHCPPSKSKRPRAQQFGYSSRDHCEAVDTFALCSRWPLLSSLQFQRQSTWRRPSLHDKSRNPVSHVCDWKVLLLIYLTDCECSVLMNDCYNYNSVFFSHIRSCILYLMSHWSGIWNPTDWLTDPSPSLKILNHLFHEAPPNSNGVGCFLQARPRCPLVRQCHRTPQGNPLLKWKQNHIRIGGLKVNVDALD